MKKLNKIKSENKIEKDYQDIIKSLGNDNPYSFYEWNKKGDYFKKFSLFKDYPYSIPSSDTTINYIQ